MNRAQRIAMVVGLASIFGLAAFNFSTIDRQDAATQANTQALVATIETIERAGLVGGRIVELPEDGGAWHCSLFLHDNWREIPRERQLVAWFEAEPRLASLKAQVHHHLYTESDELYRLRFRRSCPRLPAVLITDAGGKVAYKAADGSREAPLPTNPVALGDKVQKIFQRWPCPKPKPEPNPNPKPDPAPNPDVIPDLPHVPDLDVVPLGPPAEPFPTGLTVLLAAAAGVLAALATLFVKIRREVDQAL